MGRVGTKKRSVKGDGRRRGTVHGGEGQPEKG